MIKSNKKKQQKKPKHHFLESTGILFWPLQNPLVPTMPFLIHIGFMTSLVPFRSDLGGKLVFQKQSLQRFPNCARDEHSACDQVGV